jgi:two-component system chemotaxis response regulator CheB
MVQDVRAPIASSYETPSTAIETKESTAKILAIGASAGGPEALKILLGALKKELSIPILLVQHIDANFSKGFGQWLEIHTSLKVVFCDKHQELQPGVVHLAPPDHHMVIAGSGEATLNQHPPEAGHRPSVGMLFRSASRHYGASAIGVLLSGMGSDGARDLLAMRMAGAQTYAQSKESCLVFGMPGEAVKLGAARVVDHPLNIAKYINQIVP